MNAAKPMLLVSLFLSGNSFAQAGDKEPAAVIELGAAAPSYNYKFGPGHEHSLGITGGLLIGIP